MNNNKGFTLLEVILTIAIMSLVMGYFTTFFSNEIRFYYSKDNDIQLKQDARIAMDRVVTKLRKNIGLRIEEVPDVNGDNYGVIYRSDNSVFINSTKFEMGTEPPTGSKGEINFYFDEQKGYGELKDESSNTIANNIKDFKLSNFAVVNNQTLVKIYLKSGNGSTQNDKEYSTVVRLRWIIVKYVCGWFCD